MRNLCSVFFVFLFLVSCSPKYMDMGKKKENAIALQRIGEAHYNSGKYTAALKSLLEAHQTIPDDPYLNNSLGLVYLAKKKYDLAENSFKRALDTKSDYIHAKNHLGAVYLKKKKWDLAIQCFKETSENILYATPEISFSNLGWAYFHKKMFNTAKPFFNKALEIRPDFLNAIHGLASIYIETGYHIQAVDFLQNALKKNPGAAIIHSDLATVYEALKNFDHAKKSWNAVLKIEPATSPLAKEAQKRLFDLN